MLEMKTNNIALVKGASSGIGEAISRELVKRDWVVIRALPARYTMKLLGKL